MLRETQVKVRFNRISFKQILPKQKNGVKTVYRFLLLDTWERKMEVLF